MATGIISVGLHLTGFEVVSWIALAIAAAVWVLLAFDFLSRLLWDRSRWESESYTAPGLTAVAATTVIGTRISLLGWHGLALALLVVAAAVWPVLLVAVIRHWSKRMPGAAFLDCVSTQGLSVLAATLGLAGFGDWLLWAALVLFVLGAALYLAVFFRFDVKQIWMGAGDQWVAAGAVAISTLAASKLVAWHEWTGAAHSTLRMITFALLAITLVGYLILCVAEIARLRPGYDIRRWATVFPMGMTAVATLSTGAATHVPSLRPVGQILLAIAVIVWLLVSLAGIRQSRISRPTFSV